MNLVLLGAPGAGKGPQAEIVWDKLGIKMMIVDANDIAQELLGKCAALDETEADLMAMIADNPCGNGTQLTPFTLIREVKD